MVKAAKTPLSFRQVWGPRGLWGHLQGVERQGLLSIAIQAGILVKTELGRARGMGGGPLSRGDTDSPAEAPHSTLCWGSWPWALGDLILGLLSPSPTPC